MTLPILFDISTSTKVFIAVLVLAVLAREVWINFSPNVSAGSSHALPPGPKPDPLIGHLRLVPSTYQWKTFAEWAERWGLYRR